MKLIPLVLFALLPAVTLAAADALKQAIEQKTAADYPRLDALYKHLHANPELSLMEEKTSARFADELRAAGFEVTEKFGGFGVVGVLKNGAGPTILLRTDLDALPVSEETGLPYASHTRAKDLAGNETAVMHACGHDLHITVMTGTARTLASLRDRWSGTLVVIGQPAEERGIGARAMLTAGLYQKFPRPDFAVALHDNATLAAGKVGFVEGYALANVDSVDILVRGVGGHGAYPHTTKDPIVLAARIVTALQTIVSRETRPTDPAVVTVGSIHGGAKHNVVPDEVKLQLTLRSYTDAVREHSVEAIRRICRGEAIAAGIPEDRMPVITVHEEEFTPATYNDPNLTRRLRQAVTATLGERQVASLDPVMGGEDFSQYGRTVEKVPVCLFWLGAVASEKIAEADRTGVPLPSLHSRKFAPVPEPAIKTGIVALSAAALELLEKR